MHIFFCSFMHMYFPFPLALSVWACSLTCVCVCVSCRVLPVVRGLPAGGAGTHTRLPADGRGQGRQILRQCPSGKHACERGRHEHHVLHILNSFPRMHLTTEPFVGFLCILFYFCHRSLKRVFLKPENTWTAGGIKRLTRWHVTRGTGSNICCTHTHTSVISRALLIFSAAHCCSDGLCLD